MRTGAANTVVGNDNGCQFTGILECGGTSFSVSNNIFWDHGASMDGCYEFSGCDGNLSYNLTSDLQAGTGNDSGDPELDENFAPSSTSPALDAAGAVDAPEVDFYGNPRPVGDGPDMGAVEVQ
jgi:hypothetical protein